MNGKNPKKYRVKMKFMGPVHFGYKEKTYNFTEYMIHSDTLFSGIINCMGLLYGKDTIDEIIDKFVNNEPPFKISSAFLYIKDDYFVPRPFDLELSDILDFKKAKKVKFVPLEFLLKHSVENKKEWDVSPTGLLISQKKYKNIVGEIERPRVTLDRVNSTCEIYYIDSCYFSENAGLWFFLDIFDESLGDKIKASIRLLGDEGLGGERTYGLGLFKADISENMAIGSLQESCYLLLSLFYPNKGEKIAGNISSYGFIERAGYIYSPWEMSKRKKKVRMLTEGSIFTSEPKGYTVDITPKGFQIHRIVRYGIAYCIPVLLKREVNRVHEI
jgi:CRISPR-associated protein Csm4